MDKLEQIKNRWEGAVKEHGYAQIDHALIDGLHYYTFEHIRPGGLLCAILANSWDAILHAHPSLTVDSLKGLTHFIEDAVPFEARGSYKAIDNWCATSTPTSSVLAEESSLQVRVASQDPPLLPDLP